MILHIFLPHCAAAKISRAMLLTAHRMILQKNVILGTVFTLMALGGILMWPLISSKLKIKVNFTAFTISKISFPRMMNIGLRKYIELNILKDGDTAKCRRSFNIARPVMRITPDFWKQLAVDICFIIALRILYTLFVNLSQQHLWKALINPIQHFIKALH